MKPLDAAGLLFTYTAISTIFAGLAIGATLATFLYTAFLPLTLALWSAFGVFVISIPILMEFMGEK